MLTPDGRACPHYYVDAHRTARAREVCHLLTGTDGGERWTSALCRHCPVPEITRANRCPTMVLHARIAEPGWRIWQHRRVVVTATCTKSGEAVQNPMVGCGLCHAPLSFVVGPDAADGASHAAGEG